MARARKSQARRAPKKPAPKPRRKPAKRSRPAAGPATLSVLDGEMKTVFREAFLKRP